mmetsp:Transcript_5364/g.15330  ORF Transcript_5364/g.15330 Transcript_5364/m.15330 type:complete len:180 (-) Transcript_5364:393-932(-)
MGLLWSCICDRFSGKRERKVLMMGLDGSGKTTILYRLKLGIVAETVPTVTYNAERVKHGEFVFTVWDVGGKDSLRRWWLHYFPDSSAVIFVVDCGDRRRISDAQGELATMMADEALREAALLVFANKRDLPGSMCCAEVTENLNLHSITNRRWHVQPASATSGEGVREGLKWLAAAVAS